MITGGTVNQCSGTFFDSGGVSGQYSANEDITFTICPGEPGNDININFASFDVESFNDILRVYQGTNTAGTLVGSYHNNNLMLLGVLHFILHLVFLQMKMGGRPWFHVS